MRHSSVLRATVTCAKLFRRLTLLKKKENEKERERGSPGDALIDRERMSEALTDRRGMNDTSTDRERMSVASDSDGDIVRFSRCAIGVHKALNGACFVHNFKTAI